MKNTVAVSDSSKAIPASGTRANPVSHRGTPHLFSAVRAPSVLFSK